MKFVNIRFATRLYTIPNNYSAVYQDELALLLIQRKSPPTAYCFSQPPQGLT